MALGTPSNPMPTGGAFIGSFITINGKSLQQHYSDVGNYITGIENIPMTAGPQLMQRAKEFAQQIVPVRTGYLRSTIDWEQLSRYIFRFFVSAKYARAVEEGTFRMRARPYAGPAMDRLRSEAPQVIINEVRMIFK